MKALDIKSNLYQASSAVVGLAWFIAKMENLRSGSPASFLESIKKMAIQALQSQSKDNLLTRMENPFEVIAQRLDRIEGLLIKLVEKSTVSAPLPPQSKYIQAKEAAEIIQISKQTLYARIKFIPHVKRFGRLYFVKDDLLDYIANGPVEVLSQYKRKGGLP